MKISILLTLFVVGISNPQYLLSDNVYTAFHKCLISTGFQFEALPHDPMLIRSFIVCCSSIVLTEGAEYGIDKKIEAGADGRDIISMSPSEIQYIFSIDKNFSNLIFLFIARQLTAYLPDSERRYQ